MFTESCDFHFGITLLQNIMSGIILGPVLCPNTSRMIENHSRIQTHESYDDFCAFQFCLARRTALYLGQDLGVSVPSIYTEVELHNAGSPTWFASTLSLSTKHSSNYIKRL